MMHALLAALIAVLSFATAAVAQDREALKRSAIERLAASHDPSIVIGVGRVYVKQTALLKARAVIAEQGALPASAESGTHSSPSGRWRNDALMADVDPEIAREIEDPAWFRAAWGGAAASVLDAEEADEIANHFATEGGALQRQVIELLLVGETLVANYTFTDRIRYDVKARSTRWNCCRTRGG